jgi:phage I-like protein
MSIVAIIAGSIVVITVIAILGDTIQTAMKSKARVADSSEVSALKARLAALEAKVEERESSFQKIQEDLRFMTRMLEDKTGR